MKNIVTLTLIAALCAGAAAGGYWYAQRQHPAAQASPASVAAPPPESGRKVLYWYDPMYPQQRFEKPGKSPFMDMQLVPRYADEALGEAGIAIDPRVVQNLGVRTSVARIGSLAGGLAAVGTVTYNERSIVLVQPRVNGFIEKLHVRAPLDPVAAGAPLVEMLFPDWAAAQEEFLLLRRLATPDAETLRAAARQRLTLLGMSEDQIAAVERDGTVHTRVTLRSPIAGVIVELGAREGMTAMAGTTLFRIASLATVWVVAEVPETQAGMMVPGGTVEVRVPAYPGDKFAGKVGAILPEINTATRTVRARIEVANSGGKLRPGMFANLAFAGRGREVLLVPSEAVIHTGERTVVVVEERTGRFRAAEVEAGAEGDGSTEIRKGLQPGDRVVISGQFLIDSEASLRSTLGRLSASASAQTTSSTPAALHTGRGRITGIDAAKGTVEIEHTPIASLKWPAMTMPFSVENRKQLGQLRTGDAVEFEVRGAPNAEGDYVLVRVAPAPAVAPASPLPPQTRARDRGDHAEPGHPSPTRTGDSSRRNP
jgi:Cu(I)/Ag(I) efflux system membrane fusion protein